ncbi:MAG TPA: hypothetical protein VKZ68_00910 [Ohtaekwangia sp.]|nr:hypothetical protein [Ohtaekwangia sp.]
MLHSVKEEQIGVKVRTHTGWSSDYLNIIGFIASTRDKENKTFTGVVLSNLNETEGILINNISSITAFELERACEQYKGGIVYHLRDNISLKTLILN